MSRRLNVSLSLSEESVAALLACVDFARGALEPVEFGGELSALGKAADALSIDVRLEVARAAAPEGSIGERWGWFESSPLKEFAFDAYCLGHALRNSRQAVEFKKVALSAEGGAR